MGLRDRFSRVGYAHRVIKGSGEGLKTFPACPQKEMFVGKVEYPKWLYKGKESIIVANEEEHQALGKGWKESPAEPAKQPTKNDDSK